jgi:hypothetical protein
MLSVVILSLVLWYRYDVSCYAECRYAERLYAGSHYAGSHYADCR